MFILIISIAVWIISGSFLVALTAMAFMYFLLVGFKVIDALLSNKEIAGILSLLGLAWLLGSNEDDIDLSEKHSNQDDFDSE